jgi:uncharacterized spore protein YtfJ
MRAVLSGNFGPPIPGRKVMSLNRLFEVVERARETAQWQAAFGEPEVADGRVVIPVAKVGYGFGLGFGEGIEPPSREEEPQAASAGGGAGGGSSAKPLGVVVVDDEGVYFEEVVDTTKVSLAGIGLVALAIVQVAITLRAFLRRG